MNYDLDAVSDRIEYGFIDYFVEGVLAHSEIYVMQTKREYLLTCKASLSFSI